MGSVGDSIAEAALAANLTTSALSFRPERQHDSCDPERGPTGDRHALPPEPLPREAWQIAAQRAGEVVEAEVDRARGPAVDLRGRRDAELSGRDPGPVGERD